MLDTKIIIVVIAVAIVAGFMYKKHRDNKASTENFGFGGLPSMTWKRDRVMAGSQQAAAKGDFYSVPGTYQAILEPRFSNTQYGSNIRYNLPSYDNMAAPCEPLTFGNMAREDYQEDYVGCGSCGGGCSAATCGKGGAPASIRAGAPMMDGDYSAGNYGEVLDELDAGGMAYPETTDMVPVGDMTSVNALGETVQPIVYDRYIYANRNSRLRSLGDPIRGDLPIVPCAADWFRPSVHPNIDLQQGAMNVMGGIDNGTTRGLAELINTTSGDHTIAGVNMASMRNMTTGAGMADVSVSAFP